jgi:protein-arginine kinase activator protein McsA
VDFFMEEIDNPERIPEETDGPAFPGKAGREKTPPLSAEQMGLQGELEQAVANEDYERAAKIRDLIRILAGDSGKKNDMA